MPRNQEQVHEAIDPEDVSCVMVSTTISPLHRADGSATYSRNGFTVIAAVNGPIEVQRRDELPEEAAIDVNLRPASGVGGVRERHLESIIQNTLRHIVLVSAQPRTLIQITLQVIASQGNDATSSDLSRASSNLPVLPALLQASVLALLSTSIPMSMSMTATLIAVQPKGGIEVDPSIYEIKSATSIHVLAFSSHKELLLVESEGNFSLETWEHVLEKGSQICYRGDDGDSDGEDVDMISDNKVNLEGILRDVLREKIVKERRWKETSG